MKSRQIIDQTKGNQSLAHNNTVFSQLLKLVPRHEFETLANKHHSGRSFRTASRWSQFVTMAMAQLSGRNSLRDIVENLSAQMHRLYHLGSTKISRSNLSRINEDKPYSLYEALFAKLLRRCQGMTPGHHFRFKNPLYSLDASTIDLCLAVFPWAQTIHWLLPSAQTYLVHIFERNRQILLDQIPDRVDLSCVVVL